jgi:hypothetical protein
MATNIEALRLIYDAFNRGDIPAVVNAMTPDVEWHMAESSVYADGSPYRGPDAVVQGVFGRLGADFDGFRVKPEEFLDAGETVIVLGHYEATARTTRMPVRAEFAHIFTMRGGRIHHYRQFTDTAKLEKAVQRVAAAG